MNNLDIVVKAPIKTFFRPTSQKLTHAKFCGHAKNFDPRKNIFDPHNPRENYDPRKKYFDPCIPRNPRKNLTHATHASMDPRTHVTHVTTQPTRYGRLSLDF